MIWPSWGQRDCCCRGQSAEARVAADLLDLSTLPPCCAARLRAQSQAAERTTAGPVWRAHCGCQPEWQAAEYTPATRYQFTIAYAASHSLPVTARDETGFVPADVVWIDAQSVDQGGQAGCIRLSRWLA